MVTHNSCFVHDPQIPNLNLANLEFDPFWQFSPAFWASELHDIEKLHNTKC